jgi:hypothetical protein
MLPVVAHERTGAALAGVGKTGPRGWKDKIRGREKRPGVGGTS